MTTESPKSEFLGHIHAFRGFAILTIVGAPAWSFMIFWTGQLTEPLKPVFWLTESLFHGSTIYFAIISGLLFNKVLSSRGWKRFYLSKLNNVLLPFCAMSLFYTAVWWQYIEQSAQQRGEDINFITTWLSTLPAGTAALHFWYIPMLCFLFAITPLLFRLQRISIWPVLAIALLPLVISRSPFPNFLMPQSFVYFTGAYALGMLIGEYHQNILQYVSRRWRWIMVLVVLTTGIIYLQYASGYQNDWFYSSRQTLIYIQKVAITLLLIWGFYQIADRLPRWLIVLADNAFAIFFLHVFFIGLIIGVSSELMQQQRTGMVTLGLGFMALIASVGASVVVSWCLQKLLKRHSRKLIGA